MDAITLQALKNSIEHWKENEAAASSDMVSVWSDDCALCQLFVDRTGSCDGCPVAKKTGLDQCKGSPWSAARDAFYYWRNYQTRELEGNFRFAAKAEREFLESLIPSENK